MDYGIFNNNLSAKILINKKIEIANRPLNKYNFSIQQDVEEYVGEPSDRQPSDVGIGMGDR